MHLVYAEKNGIRRSMFPNATLPTDSLPTIVQSIMRLVETGMEDGEQAESLDSEYLDVTCVVTSDIDGINLVAGECA